MLSFLVPLLVAQAAPPLADIIVRAQRIDAALSKCLARRCSVADDVRLSIALAEAQFANGAYHDAQRTLDRAIGRNKHAAKAQPHLVAALYEANATVNLHRGDLDAQRTAMIGQSRTLQNLSDNDQRRLLLGIELGDYYVKRGNWREADRRYAAAQHRYTELGQTQLAALAAIRGAHAAFARNNLVLAQRRLDAVATMPAVDDPTVATLRTALTARVAAASAAPSGPAPVLPGLRTDPASAPVLLYEAPAELNAEQAAASQPDGFLRPNAAAAVSSEVKAIQWADIGFRVAADGTVSDVEVLRGNKQLGWTAAQVRRIASRRYAPLNLAPGQPEPYRIERLTWRAEHITPTGSLIKRGAGPRSLQVQDMTKTVTILPSK